MYTMGAALGVDVTAGTVRVVSVATGYVATQQEEGPPYQRHLPRRWQDPRSDQQHHQRCHPHGDLDGVHTTSYPRGTIGGVAASKGGSLVGRKKCGVVNNNVFAASAATIVTTRAKAAESERAEEENEVAAQSIDSRKVFTRPAAVDSTRALADAVVLPSTRVAAGTAGRHAAHSQTSTGVVSTSDDGAATVTGTSLSADHCAHREQTIQRTRAVAATEGGTVAASTAPARDTWAGGARERWSPVAAPSPTAVEAVATHARRKQRGRHREGVLGRCQQERQSLFVQQIQRYVERVEIRRLAHALACCCRGEVPLSHPSRYSDRCCFCGKPRRQRVIYLLLIDWKDVECVIKLGLPYLEIGCHLALTGSGCFELQSLLQRLLLSYVENTSFFHAEEKSVGSLQKASSCLNRGDAGGSQETVAAALRVDASVPCWCSYCARVIRPAVASEALDRCPSVSSSSTLSAAVPAPSSFAVKSRTPVGAAAEDASVHTSSSIRTSTLSRAVNLSIPSAAAAATAREAPTTCVRSPSVVDIHSKTGLHLPAALNGTLSPSGGGNATVSPQQRHTTINSNSGVLATASPPPGSVLASPICTPSLHAVNKSPSGMSPYPPVSHYCTPSMLPLTTVSTSTTTTTATSSITSVGDHLLSCQSNTTLPTPATTFSDIPAVCVGGAAMVPTTNAVLLSHGSAPSVSAVSTSTVPFLPVRGGMVAGHSPCPSLAAVAATTTVTANKSAEDVALCAVSSIPTTLGPPLVTSAAVSLPTAASALKTASVLTTAETAQLGQGRTAVDMPVTTEKEKTLCVCAEKLPAISSRADAAAEKTASRIYSDRYNTKNTPSSAETEIHEGDPADIKTPTAAALSAAHLWQEVAADIRRQQMAHLVISFSRESVCIIEALDFLMKNFPATIFRYEGASRGMNEAHAARKEPEDFYECFLTPEERRFFYPYLLVNLKAGVSVHKVFAASSGRAAGFTSSRAASAEPFPEAETVARSASATDETAAQSSGDELTDPSTSVPLHSRASGRHATEKRYSHGSDTDSSGSWGMTSTSEPFGTCDPSVAAANGNHTPAGGASLKEEDQEEDKHFDRIYPDNDLEDILPTTAHGCISQRIGGSTIGGATFMGLCRLVLANDEASPGELLRLAVTGDSRVCDMRVRDIYGGGYEAIGLKPSTIASTLGKLQHMPLRLLRDYAIPEARNQSKKKSGNHHHISSSVRSAKFICSTVTSTVNSGGAPAAAAIVVPAAAEATAASPSMEIATAAAPAAAPAPPAVGTASAAAAVLPAGSEVTAPALGKAAGAATVPDVAVEAGSTLSPPALAVAAVLGAPPVVPATPEELAKAAAAPPPSPTSARTATGVSPAVPAASLPVSAPTAEATSVALAPALSAEALVKEDLTCMTVSMLAQTSEKQQMSGLSSEAVCGERRWELSTEPPAALVAADSTPTVTVHTAARDAESSDAHTVDTLVGEVMGSNPLKACNAVREAADTTPLTVDSFVRDAENSKFPLTAATAVREAKSNTLAVHNAFREPKGSSTSLVTAHTAVRETKAYATEENAADGKRLSHTTCVSVKGMTPVLQNGLRKRSSQDWVHDVPVTDTLLPMNTREPVNVSVDGGSCAVSINSHPETKEEETCRTNFLSGNPSLSTAAAEIGSSACRRHCWRRCCCCWRDSVCSAAVGSSETRGDCTTECAATNPTTKATDDRREDGSIVSSSTVYADDPLHNYLQKRTSSYHCSCCRSVSDGCCCSYCSGCSNTSCKRCPSTACECFSSYHHGSAFQERCNCCTCRNRQTHSTTWNFSEDDGDIQAPQIALLNDTSNINQSDYRCIAVGQCDDRCVAVHQCDQRRLATTPGSTRLEIPRHSPADSKLHPLLDTYHRQRAWEQYQHQHQQLLQQEKQRALGPSDNSSSSSSSMTFTEASGGGGMSSDKLCDTLMRHFDAIDMYTVTCEVCGGWCCNSTNSSTSSNNSTSGGITTASSNSTNSINNSTACSDSTSSSDGTSSGDSTSSSNSINSSDSTSSTNSTSSNSGSNSSSSNNNSNIMCTHWSKYDDDIGRSFACVNSCRPNNCDCKSCNENSDEKSDGNSSFLRSSSNEYELRCTGTPRDCSTYKCSSSSSSSSSVRRSCCGNDRGSSGEDMCGEHACRCCCCCLRAHEGHVGSEREDNNSNTSRRDVGQTALFNRRHRESISSIDSKSPYEEKESVRSSSYENGGTVCGTYHGNREIVCLCRTHSGDALTCGGGTSCVEYRRDSGSSVSSDCLHVTSSSNSSSDESMESGMDEGSGVEEEDEDEEDEEEEEVDTTRNLRKRLQDGSDSNGDTSDSAEVTNVKTRRTNRSSRRSLAYPRINIDRRHLRKPCPADIVRSLLTMMSFNLAQQAYLHAVLHGLKRIVLAGFLLDVPGFLASLQHSVRFWSKNECKVYFCSLSAFLGALGACLSHECCSVESTEEPWDFSCAHHASLHRPPPISSRNAVWHRVRPKESEGRRQTVGSSNNVKYAVSVSNAGSRRGESFKQRGSGAQRSTFPGLYDFSATNSGARWAQQPAFGYPTWKQEDVNMSLSDFVRPRKGHLAVHMKEGECIRKQEQQENESHNDEGHDEDDEEDREEDDEEDDDDDSENTEEYFNPFFSQATPTAFVPEDEWEQHQPQQQQQYRRGLSLASDVERLRPLKSRSDATVFSVERVPARLNPRRASDGPFHSPTVSRSYWELLPRPFLPPPPPFRPSAASCLAQSTSLAEGFCLCMPPELPSTLQVLRSNAAQSHRAPRPLEARRQGIQK